MRSVVAGILFLTLLAGCGSPAEPVPPAPPPAGHSLRVISQPAPIDTILGFFQDSLILEIRDADGLPAENVWVQYGGSAQTPGAYFEMFYKTSITDVSGRVRALVQAGTVAGIATLTYYVSGSISEPPLSGSIPLLMTPGAPASVTVTPDHALLSVGGTQTFDLKTVDRGGNVLAPVPVLVPFGELSVSGTTVTATGPGNYRVEGRAAGVTGTAPVDVVPVGQVVYHTLEGQLVSRNLDGSGLTVLMDGGTSPVWMTDGSVLAIGPAATLVRVVPGSPAGPQPFLAADAPADLVNIAQPLVSTDGRYVYFLASRLSDTVPRIYRTAADGTGAVALPVPEPVIQFSVSPDPLVIAYHTGARPPGRVYHLDTGAFFDFGPFQHFPWWSPQGDLIAFGTGNETGLHIYTASGQFVRTLHPEWYFESIWMTWSRDERFILGHQGSIMRLADLVNGSLVVLPFLAELIGSSIRIP